MHKRCMSLKPKGARTFGGSVPEIQTEEDNKCQECYTRNDIVGEFGS